MTPTSVRICPSYWQPPWESSEWESAERAGVRAAQILDIFRAIPSAVARATTDNLRPTLIHQLAINHRRAT